MYHKNGINKQIIISEERLNINILLINLQLIIKITTLNHETHHGMSVIRTRSVAIDGFGGLVVSKLATGTPVRGFKSGRSHWIFRASGKSSVCLPSERK